MAVSDLVTELEHYTSSDVRTLSNPRLKLSKV